MQEDEDPSLTCWGLSSLDGTGDSVVVDLAILHLAQSFRARSHQLHVSAIQVKHVRTRVDLPQMPIRVERVKRCWSAQPLRWHGLDDVPLDDVLLELGNESLVSRFADVRDRFVSSLDRRLRR